LRIATGVVFLYDAVVRWPFAVELYSADGLPMPVFPPELFPGTHFMPLPLSAFWTVVLHSLLLYSLVAVTIGWRTRTSLWVAFAISLWLGLLDQAGTFKKYSAIGLHLMLLLSFTRCGGAWSVDALLARGRCQFSQLSLAWPRRLVQVLVMAVYLGGAMTKIRLPDFANGDLLMFSLLDDQWGGGYVGQWLSTQPNLLILASIGTILFEIAFPLLIWNPRLRRPMLVLAVAFHLQLAATMHLGIFSFVMLAALLAFVDEPDLSKFVRNRSTVFACKERVGSRASAFSAAVWAIAAALLTVAGIVFHDDVDYAWGKKPRGSVVFDPIDEETSIDILASLTPAQENRYDDYFHRVELGNRLSSDGTRRLGSASRFRRGMTVHACARLIQDHPPLQVQWTLIRPDGEEVQFGYQLAASVSHATVGFALTDPEQTPPGKYRLILRADGYVVATRGFVLGD
jgi:hypothetical protein